MSEYATDTESNEARKEEGGDSIVFSPDDRNEDREEHETREGL
ncbi:MULTISPECIES: hypothetical protein [unclassified Halobacterium]|nr:MULTISPECIES: hypothetical protein [unclassified Halobacterium]